MTTPNPTFMIYRVRQSTTHPDRRVNRAWYGRTWQAEWDPCPWCPRAFTERGLLRKAARWQRWGVEKHLRYARRRQWIRCHITQRRDDFYRTIRETA